MEVPEMWSCCFFPWENSTSRLLLNYHNSGVLFTPQCKKLEFLVEIQPGFQDQQFHLRSCQSFGQSWKSHSLEMAFCFKLEYVEFVFHSSHLYNFISIFCLVPGGLSPAQFVKSFFAFETLKWEEVLRKRKSRRVPALSHSLLLYLSTTQGTAVPNTKKTNQKLNQ